VGIFAPETDPTEYSFPPRRMAARFSDPKNIGESKSQSQPRSNQAGGH
jgi:hypothetical protein